MLSHLRVNHVFAELWQRLEQHYNEELNAELGDAVVQHAAVILQPLQTHISKNLTIALKKDQFKTFTSLLVSVEDGEYFWPTLGNMSLGMFYNLGFSSCKLPLLLHVSDAAQLNSVPTECFWFCEEEFQNDD